MLDTTAGILLDTLSNWGVDVIFGLPGDGINGIMEGLRKRKHRIRFIQVRHEEAAAFMACGYARYAKRLGACLATSGPGGIHLVSGLYAAKLENLPVIALTGHHYHDLIGTHTQQDVDLTKLFGNVAVYSERVMGPAHVENVAHVACRNALGFHGVAHINIATDIQDERFARRSKENVAHHQSAARSLASQPSEHALRRAADVLNAGRSVVLLCGSEAVAARAEIGRLAETLAAPIVLEGLGQTVAFEGNPHCVGCLGVLGAPAARRALMQGDVILLLDAPLPYDEATPLAEGMRVVELVPGLGRSTVRRSIEVSLSGGIASTLQALLPRLQKKDSREFLHQARQEYEAWQRGGNGEQSPTQSSARIPSQVLARALSERLGTQDIFVSDSAPVQGELSIPDDEFGANFTTLPYGLPYALAAQLAFPERRCVAVLKQPSFSMLMGEFATAVKYNLPIRAVVLNGPANGSARLDLAGFAKACGGSGFMIGSELECDAVLEQAFKEAGPVLVAA